MAQSKRVFSGIQPTGGIHLGNYLGALRQWVDLQKEYECLYCVVDLHAITVPPKPDHLKRNVFDTAALLLSVGVEPEKSVLFVQSDVPQHAELAWVLDCYAYMGELRRMTQFKEKAGRESETSNVGLFGYPVLMAADIFLYNATHVPVGEDQTQHLELARTLARRFNNIYGEILTEPQPIIPKQGARIMGLDDPTKKMSKSASSAYSYVLLLDSPDTVREKFKSATTDSGREVAYDVEKKAGISNLLDIFSLVSGKSVADLAAHYGDKGYGAFKKDAGEAVVEFLRPIQEKYAYWKARPADVREILDKGGRRALEMAEKKMEEVKNTVGLGLPKA